MLFQKKLTRFDAVPAATLIAMAALAMTTLPVAAAVPSETVSEDDGVLTRMARSGRVFSAHRLYVGPVSFEASVGRRDCADDGVVTVRENRVVAEAMLKGQIGCPAWLALDDFTDVDYGIGGIGITMCRLDSDAPGKSTIGGGISVNLGVLSFGITFGGGGGDMCSYMGCGLVVSEAAANYAART